MCLWSLEFLHHRLQFLNVDLPVARLVVPEAKYRVDTMNDIIRQNYVNITTG